jgi:acyl carrier protein
MTPETAPALSGYTLARRAIKLRRPRKDGSQRSTRETCDDRRCNTSAARHGAGCGPESGSNMHSRDEVLDRIRSTLVELFQLSSEDITPEARLYEDLEIDSIDVIDLMDEMHRRTGRRATPEDFRSVRTVGDLVGVLQRLMQ